MIEHQKHNQFKVFSGVLFADVARDTTHFFNVDSLTGQIANSYRPKSMSIGLVNGRYLLTVGYDVTKDQPHYNINLRQTTLGADNLLYEASILERILTKATDEQEVICHDLFVEQGILTLYTMEVA